MIKGARCALNHAFKVATISDAGGSIGTNLGVKGNK